MSASLPSLYSALIRHGELLQKLCECGAVRVREPGLRVVLGEHAQSLARLLAELRAQQCQFADAQVVSQRWMGLLSLHLAKRSMRGAAACDQGWIRLLARREARLLQLLERGIEDTPAPVAAALQRLMPQVRSVHLDMHELAQAAG